MVSDKSTRIAGFYKEAVTATFDLVSAAALLNPNHLYRSNISRRFSQSEFKGYVEMYLNLTAYCLL